MNADSLQSYATAVDSGVHDDEAIEVSLLSVIS